ncbi:hypothetical protein ALTERO38_51968 [Alteromonas sp. 38]|nr:hypothetical protein ALTER154_50261 [Alteromonas sp. 154]VXB94176.1 hypothetical protein ALTERO38_51968 [Alteromonas sp. 38]
MHFLHGGGHSKQGSIPDLQMLLSIFTIVMLKGAKWQKLTPHL